MQESHLYPLSLLAVSQYSRAYEVELPQLGNMKLLLEQIRIQAMIILTYTITHHIIEVYYAIQQSSSKSDNNPCLSKSTAGLLK